ncbi:hypothetical protein [Microscilla marina]|uniref:Uncharacterized protein n=1 Tax=Microscilla marina ATCC 23134 TaxID=313606 RepID=A1ZYP2_MICM2|nr:hypothetical protein [Microscilla marina]EAY24466.1 hypothetical protein M23134_06453 [Microscilla marina ATCC 23134]
MEQWEAIHEGFLRYYFSLSSTEIDSLSDDEFARQIALLEYIREEERKQTALNVSQSGVYSQ